MSPRMLHTKQCLPSIWIKASICMPTHVQLELPTKLLYHLLLCYCCKNVLHISQLYFAQVRKKKTTSCLVKECWIILYSNCHLKECNRTKHGQYVSKTQTIDQTVGILS
jgi:hypothetical protein